MFNWLTRNAISSVKATRMRFSTKNKDTKLPKEILPEIEDYDYFLDKVILHVDKSMIIKDLIMRKSVLITRPRRWGKSLNLKMLESFFQPKFSPEGDILNDDEKRGKFRNLKIGDKHLTWNPITRKDEETKIIDLQGSLPVITLTFEDIHQYATTNNILESFRTVLFKGIEPHSYLITSKKIKNKYSKALFEQYFSPEIKNLTEIDIIFTLYGLIKSLNEHHNKKIILLVDEYDCCHVVLWLFYYTVLPQPFLIIQLHDIKSLVSIKLKNPDLYDFACTTYRNIFSVIKNCTDLVQLSVFTGVNRIGNEGIFSGINNLFHDSIMSSELASGDTEHFGFSETEIEMLIEQAKEFSDVKLDGVEIKEKLSYLYNGYRIQGRLVYNPFSVMSCLHNLVKGKELAYKNYWVNTGDPALLIDAVKKHKEISQNKLNELIKTQTQTKDKSKKHSQENKIEMLMKTGIVKFTPDAGIKFDDINTSEDSLLTLMLDAGYITSADEKEIYRIPNNEVRNQFFNSVYKAWFSDEEMELMRYTIKINEFENPKTFIKLFQKRILDKVKNEQYPEFFFQTILYTSLKDTIGALEYKTNDNKKIDIILKSPEDSTTVYIIEIKKKKSESQKTLINEGLEQILEKKYAESIMDKYQELTTIVLRIVYFEVDKLSKWKIDMAELKFTRDDLKRAIKCFVPKTRSSKKSKEAESQGIESQEVKSQKVKTQDVESQDVKSQKIKTQDVESQEIKSQHVESQEVERKKFERIEMFYNADLFEELKKFAFSYFFREKNKID